MTHTIGWLRAILVAASLAAIVLVVTGLMAGAEQQGSHGWTYDTATGVVTASADAWHKPGDGPITVTLWRRDTHGGPQVRLHRVTIPSEVPVTVALGVLPADACGGQWDVRASDGTWLAGQQWQLPGCGATTTTTTTSSSTTTDPTWTSTTTAPPTTTSTTSSGTSSTSTAATTTAGATGSTLPPTTSSGPTGGAPLPVTGADWRLGFLGLGLVALGVFLIAATRRTGRYAR